MEQTATLAGSLTLEGFPTMVRRVLPLPLAYPGSIHSQTANFTSYCYSSSVKQSSSTNRDPGWLAYPGRVPDDGEACLTAAVASPAVDIAQRRRPPEAILGASHPQAVRERQGQGEVWGDKQIGGVERTLLISVGVILLYSAGANNTCLYCHVNRSDHRVSPASCSCGEVLYSISSFILKKSGGTNRADSRRQPHRK